MEKIFKKLTTPKGSLVVSGPYQNRTDDSPSKSSGSLVVLLFRESKIFSDGK